MPKTHPRSLRFLLRRRPVLNRIREEVQRQAQIAGRLRKLLPAPLAERLLGVHMQRNQLVVFTDSAGWATRFRFLAPQILSGMRQDFPGIAGVRVKIMADAARVKATPPGQKYPLDNTRKMAKTPSSRSLDESLARLGETIRRRAARRADQDT